MMISVMRYDPRDLGGRLMLVWDHDILRFEVDSYVLGVVEGRRKDRGYDQRRCNSVGKKAKRRRRVQRRVVMGEIVCGPFDSFLVSVLVF